MPNLPLFIPFVADGWLITEHAIRETNARDYTFIAFLADDLPSELVLVITQQLVKSRLKRTDTTNERINRNGISEAVFLYLNDGTQYHNHIIASTANIEARKVYYCRTSQNENGRQILTWSEPSVIVLNGERELDFWQTWSILLPLTYRSLIFLGAK